jgi:hypothetical protein
MVTVLLNAQEGSRQALCEDQLDLMLATGEALAGIVGDKQEAGKWKMPEGKEEVQTALRLMMPADWDAALGVAQLFDEDILSLVYPRSSPLRKGGRG